MGSLETEAVRQRIKQLIDEQQRLDAEQLQYDQELLELRSLRSQCAAEVQTLQRDAEAADASIAMIQQNAAQTEQEAQQRIEAAEQASRATAKELESKLEAAQTKLAQLQQETELVRQQTNDLGAIKAEIAALKSRLASRKGAMALHIELVGEQSRADKAVSTLSSQRDALLRHRDAVLDERSALETERANLIAELAGLLDMKAEAEGVLASMRLDVVRTQAEIQQLSARAARPGV